ncbi:MAG: LuxR family transcriptional regulator [Alcaligenaceae bacterium]|nr:MAG: LuxR family transcriptional regulator [Alcaligenaceae bacterium]
MDGWAEELLTAVEETHDEHAIFLKVAAAARGLGFEQCSYGLRLPLPLTNPKTFVVSNHPMEWQRRYTEAGYVAIDPSVLHGRRSQTPLVWDEQLFAKERKFWDEAHSAGLRVGWAQSSLDGLGIGGMLTMSRSGELLTPAELKHKESKMRWLVNIAHLTMARAITPKLQSNTGVHLTVREVEVLKWAADGKTSSEISDILCIATDTVNFHIKNSVTKLGAANKTAAVVRAAMLGLLI